jgi:hypothetical protein
LGRRVPVLAPSGDPGDRTGRGRVATVGDVAAEVEHLRAHLTRRNTVTGPLAPFRLRLRDTGSSQDRDTCHSHRGAQTCAPRDSLHGTPPP